MITHTRVLAMALLASLCTHQSRAQSTTSVDPLWEKTVIDGTIKYGNKLGEETDKMREIAGDCLERWKRGQTAMRIMR